MNGDKRSNGDSGQKRCKYSEGEAANSMLHAVPLSVAIGPNLPRMLQGGTGAIAIPDLRQFKVQAQSAAMANVAQGGFEAMYAQSVDHVLHGTGAETFEAIDMLRKIDITKFPPENGA